MENERLLIRENSLPLFFSPGEEQFLFVLLESLMSFSLQGGKKKFPPTNLSSRDKKPEPFVTAIKMKGAFFIPRFLIDEAKMALFTECVNKI